jgi:hypothetical protein
VYTLNESLYQQPPQPVPAAANQRPSDEIKMNQIKQEPPPGPKRNFDIEKNSSKLKEKGEASSKENNDSRIEDKNEDSDSGLDSCSIGKLFSF